mgnify:CR=1 FL=1
MLAFGVTLLYYLKLYINGGENRHWPDLSGQTIIVTGANSGIGFETAKELLRLHPKNLILACRDIKKASIAMEKLNGGHSRDNLVCMHLDLSDLRSVERFVQKFAVRFEKLDILINNAGLLMPDRKLSPQGHELTFASNHLGKFKEML